MNDTTTLETDLLYEVRDGIGRITFNRPQARNALTFNMYRRLAEICTSAGSDRSLKVLILTGAGDKAFASGTDINQFRAFSTPQDAIDYETRIDEVLGTLEQCQVPIIAAINGFLDGISMSVWFGSCSLGGLSQYIPELSRMIPHPLLCKSMWW